MGHRTPLSIGLAAAGGLFLIAALVYAMVVKHVRTPRVRIVLAHHAEAVGV